jgi:molecular chaperone Hsp33
VSTLMIGKENRVEELKKDYVVTGMTSDGLFRILAVRSTLTVEEGRRRHNTSKTATAALGRVMTGALLMASTLDEDQSVTLRVLGDGPAGGIISEAMRTDKEVLVRGYMGNPNADLLLNDKSKLDVGGIVGNNGYVHVTKDLGLREQYTGSAQIQSGEIGIDLAYYYTVSEQLPTALSLGVRIGGRTRTSELSESKSSFWVTGAGGIMVQVMPGRSPEEGGEAAQLIQENLEKMGSVSYRIQEGAWLEELILDTFQDISKVELMDRFPVRFACKCSRDRAESTLLSVGKKELVNLAEEQEITEVRCHFCNESYSFSSEDLLKIASEIEGEK